MAELKGWEACELRENIMKRKREEENERVASNRRKIEERTEAFKDSMKAYVDKHVAEIKARFNEGVRIWAESGGTPTFSIDIFKLKTAEEVSAAFYGHGKYPEIANRRREFEVAVAVYEAAQEELASQIEKDGYIVEKLVLDGKEAFPSHTTRWDITPTPACNPAPSLVSVTHTISSSLYSHDEPWRN
jgi:hypothetical protein